MGQKLFLGLYFIFSSAIMAYLPHAYAEQKQQAQSASYTWEKDTIYVLDTSKENTIVQLPVLKLHIENLACTVGTAQKNYMPVILIEPNLKRAWEENISFPAAINKGSYNTQINKLYAHYGFTKLQNPYSMWLFPPLVNYGNTALLLLSPTPVMQWTIRSSQKDFIVTECALTSPRKEEVLISYRSADNKNEDKTNQLALVNLKTGCITDIPGIRTTEWEGDNELPITYALWLNDHQMAFTFRGRKNADWHIYEIPSGKLLEEGMDVEGPTRESVVTHFYVCHDHLLTGTKEHIISLYPREKEEKKTSDQ